MVVSFAQERSGVPRIRGDDPVVRLREEFLDVCSPHTRG